MPPISQGELDGEPVIVKPPLVRLGGPREALFQHAITAFCWTVSRTLPPQRRYWAALGASRLLIQHGGRFAPKSTAGANSSARLAHMLHRFLDNLAMFGTFPIPMVIEGEDLLKAYAAMPGGFVCCSAHIPFVKTFFPIARKAIGDDRERRVISRTPEIGNVVEIWNDLPWKVLYANSSVLLQVRALLRRNGCLLAMLDKDKGEFISANIFRFVGKVHSRVLTWFPELQSDGRILVRILEPPGPQCRNEEEICANLNFVQENIRRILRGDPPHVAAASASVANDDRSRVELQRDQHRAQLYSNDQLKERIQRMQILLSENQGKLVQKQAAEQRLAMLESEMQSRKLV